MVEMAEMENVPKEHRQQGNIVLLYDNVTIVITPKTSGREFGEMLISKFGARALQILHGLTRVNGTAAQHILKEMRTLDQWHREQNRPKIDTYG
jgi:hypothetical protein